jgi:GH25 family lysozyme M1 (1,4-beta-N-acetylmuramidase)
MKKLIFDVSSYQGKIDYDKLLSGDKEKPSAMIVRSGISWGYVDKLFVMNYTEFSKLLPTTVYHVIRADAPAKQQVDAWLKLLDLAKWNGSTAIIPDVELANGMNKQVVTDRFFETVDYIKSKGLKAVNYSARWFMIQSMLRHPRYADFFWMLAAYGLTADKGYREMPSEEFLNPKYKYLPDDIPASRVLVHQFTDRFNNSAGREYGMESEGLDASRFLGTDEQFEWMFGKTVQAEPVNEISTIISDLESATMLIDSAKQKLKTMEV